MNVEQDFLARANYFTALKGEERFREFFIEPLKAQRDGYLVTLKSRDSEEASIRYAQGAISIIDFILDGLVDGPARRLQEIEQIKKEKHNERRTTNTGRRERESGTSSRRSWEGRAETNNPIPGRF